MNTSEGRLFYATGIDNSQLRADAAESRNILHSIGQTATQEGENIDAIVGKLAKGAGVLFGASKLKDFTKEIISVRGEIERLEISFETLAGKSKGNSLFNEIRQFATSTPMMMKDLAQGAQTMLAFNIEAEKVMPMLRAIGDISMGDAQKFNSLSLSFSQMSATGKLMGQDLLQMINAGFNPLSVISEKTGKSIGELKEEMEKGKITVEMVTDAFLSATSAGGKFYGMLEKQSNGIEGAISNFQGAVDDALNAMGTSIQGTTVSIVNAGTTLVQHYDTILDIVEVLIATYGTYRAALIVNEATERLMASANAERIAMIEAEISAIGVKTVQEQLSIDADIAAAVAKGTLTEAEGLHILAVKQEAAARVESLAIAAKQAAAEAEAAAAARMAAGERLKAAEANCVAMEMELEAAIAKGEVFEIAVAKERLETAQVQINTASQQYQAAATAESAAAKAAQTAQTTANTAAQGLNNIMMQKGQAQAGVFKLAVQSLTKTFKGLWATMMAHPGALLLAAVVALGTAIYKLATAQTESEKAQRRLNDATKEMESSISAERVQIDVMFDRLRKAKEGTEAYKDAKEAIIQQYGKYLNGLNDEIASLKDVEGAYNAVSEAAIKSARSRAMSQYLDSESQEYQKKEQKSVEKIKKLLAKTMGKEAAEAMSQEIHDVIDGNKQWSKSFLQKYNQTSVYADAYGNAVLQSFNQLENLTENARKDRQAFVDLNTNAPEKFGLASKEEPEDSGKKQADPKKWKEEVARQQKALTDAQAEVKKLKASATSTTDEVKTAQEKVDAAKQALKNLGVDTDKSGGTGSNKASDVEKQNADMLANEAANRRKQEEEYAKQLADQVKDSEFEIRQARIDAMKEGADKELQQNQLNYDRLIEQNKRRERDLLDNLADRKIREMEQNDPLIFKQKNKDGRLEEVTGKRDEIYREIRATLTVDDLSDQQREQIEEFGKIAAEAFRKGEENSLEKMLQDVMTYEQQRTAIAEEYARKRNSLYEKNKDGSIRNDEYGNPVFRKGASERNVAELDYQESEALKAVDEQFAQREETYQAWCEQIANLSLKQLEDVLANAKKELEELRKNGSQDQNALATARAKVNKAEKAVKTENAKNQTNPGKRTIKEWEDLYKTLNEVKNSFEEMGEAVGGTIGEIISEAGQMASSTLSMINGIVTLVNTSKTGLVATGQAGAAALSTMEKASVILTVISAAMQIAMQIVNLFNSDDQKQEEIERLQGRIDQLQWELDHAEVVRSQKFAEGGSYLAQVKQTLQETRIEIMRSAAATHDWNTYYRAMFSTASRNTLLMEDSVNKLAKAYANVAYSADKALGEDKYKGANEELKKFAEQQILLQEQLENEKSKKKSDKDTQKEIEQKIEETGQKAIELINNLVEDIIGDTATGISEKLADAFFDAFEAGEDAAKAWGDKVKDIAKDVVKRMIISQALEKPVGEIINKYKGQWFEEDGKFKGADNVTESMNEFGSDLNGLLGAFQQMIDSLPEEVKEMLTGDSDREASQKGIATASQDSVDELNGRATAIQSHTFSISENTKLLLSTTQSILKSVMHIEEETTGLEVRMARMEGNLKELNDTVGDIATKGIRLKA